MYNFDEKHETSKYVIEIDTTARYGYFEHKELGDSRGGGLWFDDADQLTDYDGVCELPKQVKELLHKINRIQASCLDNF